MIIYGMPTGMSRHPYSNSLFITYVGTQQQIQNEIQNHKYLYSGHRIHSKIEMNVDQFLLHISDRFHNQSHRKNEVEIFYNIWSIIRAKPWYARV